jgi:adenosylhomocysteinase
MPDSSLIEDGRASYEWARSHMPVFSLVERHVRSSGMGKHLHELQISACLHVSKETSVLIRSLKALGANVSLVAANPLSSQDQVAAFLRDEGIEVDAASGETSAEYTNAITKLARSEPDLIIDDGGELHIAYSESGARSCFGGTDETTSGTVRLQALAYRRKLRYPVIPVNEAETKHLFDNKYGTGQSALDGFLRATSLLLAGKVVVVAGYGWVGKGVAERVRGMGSRVIVTEVDPIRALEAHFDGYEVKMMREASSQGDLFLTCTGQIDVLNREHFAKMKDGAIVGNVGHFDREINVSDLFAMANKIESVRRNVSKFELGKKKKNNVYLLDRGRVVNLVSAEGHPPEIMQLSFSNQLMSLCYLAEKRRKLARIPASKRVLKFPRQIDDVVARLAIRAFGINLDRLNRRQMEYRKTTTRIEESPAIPISSRRP